MHPLSRSMRMSCALGNTSNYLRTSHRYFRPVIITTPPLRRQVKLCDVMGEGTPSSSSTNGPTDSQRAPRVTLQQVVRDATVGAVDEHRQSSDGGGSSSTSGTTDASDSAFYTVQIADRYGMPAEIPSGAPQSFQELSALCPSEVLRQQLQQLLVACGWKDLTAVQRTAIPLVLDHRDILCIAPTATGKTFCYVFPSMLRLLLHANGRELSCRGDGGTEDDDMNRTNVEALLKDKIARGEVCRYCELSIPDVKVCPMTGTLHPPYSPEQMQQPMRKAMWLSELTSVAEPLLLILVPTSQLVMQVYKLCSQLHADFRVKFLVRASSAEEQKRHLKALEGCDVLITTPETMLPALYKHKLSLKRVKMLVLDEVDDLVSVNHFEKVKIVLGALPKGQQRPQRLLFGASLPPVAYQMIKEQMLLPSHRFVLADIATDNLGHPLVHGRRTVTAAITHVVFMVSQVEKISKLAWLYSSGKLTPDQRTLIFCNSRHNVAYVCERLKSLLPNQHVTMMTSRSSATAKSGTVKLFHSGASTCLVCTDILSRGIDFRNVVYVVHYDMPTEFDTWVHRSGRCGRHGLPGYSYTFFQPENIKMAKPLVAHLRQTQQMIPPKLQEYAKHSLISTFKTSLFYHPTRPYRSSDPQRQHHVMGRGTPRFPDYKQDRLNKNFRAL